MGDDGEDSYEARSDIGLMQSVSETVDDAVHSAALAIMHIPELAAESTLFHTQYDTRSAMRGPDGEDHVGVVLEQDPQGWPSLVDTLKRSGLGLHLMLLGQLCMTTEGLILLTTDGAYARELELPRNHVHRTYRVRVHGNLTPHKLKAMRSGITIKNVRYNGMQVQLEDTGRKGASSTNTWIRMTCTEGKNRQIRNVYVCQLS
jgi:pseudouridine synthase